MKTPESKITVIAILLIAGFVGGSLGFFLEGGYSGEESPLLYQLALGSFGGWLGLCIGACVVIARRLWIRLVFSPFLVGLGVALGQATAAVIVHKSMSVALESIEILTPFLQGAAYGPAFVIAHDRLVRWNGSLKALPLYAGMGALNAGAEFLLGIPGSIGSLASWVLFGLLQFIGMRAALAIDSARLRGVESNRT